MRGLLGRWSREKTAVTGLAAAAAAALALLAAPEDHPPPKAPAEAPGPRSAAALAGLFDRLGYRLDDVRRTGVVPPVFVPRLPPDLGAVASPERRKALFIRIALPLILDANQEVARGRARLLAARARAARGERPSPRERGWILSLGRRYGVEADDFAALLLRHDTIPPSLALAQAAEESGWGTSHFARRGNALFGQRLYAGGSRGMVPRGRREGETFTVRDFSGLAGSVRAYLDNLNGFHAYARLRGMRAEMRRGGAVDADRLAGALEAYSERGRDYVETIRSIMRTNRLQEFDGARLGPPRVYGAADGPGA